MKKRLLKKVNLELNLEPTRKNYLAIDRWTGSRTDGGRRDGTAAKVCRSSSAPKEAPVKKPEVMREVPEVTPEVPPKDQKPEVTVTYTRRVLTPEQQAAMEAGKLAAMPLRV